MTTEHRLLQSILLATSKAGARLFRNNVGTGWVGQVVTKSDTHVLLKNPRPLHAGLCTGSSDCIGWTPVTITADMVGRTVAVFTALEAKTGRLTATPMQNEFIQAVRDAGGIAAVVRSEDDAVRAVTITQHV